MAFKGTNSKVVAETVDKGIDGVNAINAISERYALELENVDLSEPGLVRKRTGYNVWGCTLPVKTKYLFAPAGVPPFGPTDAYRLLLEFLAVRSVSLSLYLNTAANGSATLDANFKRVDDRDNTIFVEMAAIAGVEVGLDTLFEIVDLAGHIRHVQPVEVFATGAAGENPKFLLPAYAKAWVTAAPLSDTVATPAQAKVGLGFAFPRVFGRDVLSLTVNSAVVEAGKPYVVRITWTAGSPLAALPVGTLVFFETCLRKADGSGVSGIVVARGTEYLDVETELAAQLLGDHPTHYFSLRYATGGGFWMKSGEADFVTVGALHATPDAFPVRITGASELSLENASLAGTVPLATVQDVGFIYGTDVDVGYVGLLAKYFDVETQEDRLLCGYDGHVFVETPHPAGAIPTLASGVYTGPQTLLTANPTDGTFSIPIANAHLIYALGDKIKRTYATDTAGTRVTETWDVARVDTDLLVLAGDGQRYLPLTPYTRFAFERTSDTVFVPYAAGYRPLTKGMTLQYGERNVLQPWNVIREVDFQAQAALGCSLRLERAITWESDASLTLLPLFEPVFASGGTKPISYATLPRQALDLQSASIERDVIVATGLSGLWRFNGSELINMRIPLPPAGLIRSVPGSNGSLTVLEADDGERIGNFYRFYVTYSYVELVNGKLVRYESGLNPLGSYQIAARPASDGSLTSELVELQIPTVPEGIGLPARDMTVNVYRSPSGSLSDATFETEVFLKEVELANNPDVPFVTVLAGTATKLQFTAAQYDPLFVSFAGDKTQDESQRRIIDVPLAKALSVLDNRIVAANGADQPYVNMVCADVFASDGSFAAHGKLTLVPPSPSEFSYAFSTCPVDLTVTSGTSAGGYGPAFQAIGLATYDVRSVTYNDNSHKFLIVGQTVTAGKRYLLRFIYGKKEGKVPGGLDSYYDGFGFESQVFTPTGVANEVAAQKKWTARQSNGTVATPEERVNVFESTLDMLSVATNNGLLIRANTATESNPGSFVGATLITTGAGATVFAPGDKLIFRGLGTTGQLRNASGKVLNWDFDLVASVDSRVTSGATETYALTLYVMGDTDYRLAGIASAVAVSNTATGVIHPPFTIFKFVGGPRNLDGFSLSPTTASVRIMTSPAISVVAGDRICVDGLPAAIPREGGINYNRGFEVVSFAGDTFTVKLTPPESLRGDSTLDFISEPETGKVGVPKLLFTKVGDLLEVALSPTVLTVAVTAGDWVYAVTRGRDFDSYSLATTGWFKIKEVSSNGSVWVTSLAAGQTLAKVRFEFAHPLDYSAFSGLGSSRFLFMARSGNTIGIPVPVPTARRSDADVTGAVYGPYDGYTPLEKVVRRFTHAINTVLHGSHFAYWGKFPYDQFDLNQNPPTNGFRIQPHLWPDDKYRYHYSSAALMTTSHESVWEAVGAPGYWRVEGEERFALTWTPQETKTVKRSRPSRLWWTNPTTAGFGQAFRELSIEEISSEDGEEIVGLAPYQTFSIIAKRSSCWRAGFSGGTALQLQRIPSTVGAVSARNMVATERGVFFLHTSGCYITDGGTVEPIVQPSRYFKARVVQNQSLLPSTAGHHNPLTKTVYLGVPLSDEAGSLAERVDGQFVFNYSLRGITLNTIDYGWSVNTHMPATAWVRIKSDDYFASDQGKVYRLRTEEGKTKYNDEVEAIPYKITTRFIDSQDPVDFKFYRSLFLQFGKETNSQFKVSLAWDFAKDYQQVSLFEITREGFGTAPFGTAYWGCDRYLETIRRTPVQNRVAQLSIRIEENSIDSAGEVYGIYLESTQVSNKLHKQPGT